MQAPTHFLTGILIQESIEKRNLGRLKHFLVILLGLFSHGILDKLARSTYHPANAMPTDWFWVIYHTLLALTSLIILKKFWRRYWGAILAATAPDLEWIVLHPARFLLPQNDFLQQPILHPLLSNALDTIPLLRILNDLPDWTTRRATVIFELILLAGLSAGITYFWKTIPTDTAEH